MKEIRRRVPLAALALGLAAVVLPASTAAAAPQGQAHGGHGGVHTTIQVVAEGLDTPRGVVYDKRNRRVLVAEAGQAAGNDGPCAAGAGGAIWCSGRTGAIYQFLERRPADSGRIVSNLPSVRLEDNTAVLGVHDIGLGRRGELHVVFGLSGRQSFRDALGPDGAAMATTAVIDRHGNLRSVGDLAVFEEINNPDARRVDSDPFGLAVVDGDVVVADAGSNGVLKVAPDGTVTLLANLQPRVIPEDPDYESVPTSVVRGPDGAYYVTELTGYPNYPGTARVLRFRPGQEAQVYEQGFTSLVDLTFDERGRLIVLELSKNGIYQPGDTRTGRLIRVERDGSHTVLAEQGLENPGGVAMAGPGEFYVTNRSADAGDTGQLLRIRVRG